METTNTNSPRIEFIPKSVHPYIIFMQVLAVYP
jgi:hypothetical protein